MDSFEWNKVFGAVIATVLLIMVIGIVAEQPFHHEDGKPAFSIEVAEAEGGGDVVVEGPSFAELMAGANADKGARQWAKCRACHTLDKDGANGTGPNLYGIVGRTVAALDDFNYSNALRERQTTIWTLEELSDWLKSPKSYAPGTSMSFVGVRKDDQRTDLLAYLATFSDTPVEMPTVEEAAEAIESEVAAATEGR